MEPKFVEFHRWNNEPISLKLDDITAFYPNPSKRSDGRRMPTTIIALGNNSYEVEEDYKTVSKIIRGISVPSNSISIKYSEEDRKRIEKFLEEWNKIGCTTFSSLGMTDDRVIAEFSE